MVTVSPIALTAAFMATLHGGAEGAPIERRTEDAARGADAETRALDASVALLHAAVGQLSRLACRREEWPQLLWREHTPQHFGHGGH